MTTPASPPDPVFISWSSLKRWENCKQHQLRVIKHETIKSNKGRIFLPGTVCDLVQRRWLDQVDPQPGEMVQMVEDIFYGTVDEAESKIQWRGNPREDMEQVQAECRETVSKLEPWLTDNVLPYDYQPEVRFKAWMDVPYVCEGGTAPLVMRGGIDILVRDDQGKYRLYDLKVTRDPGYLRKTLGQLTFYDVAWGVIQGNLDHAVAWGFVAPLTDEFLIPVTVDNEDRKVMLSRVMKYAQGYWSDNWTPKADDAGCNWCEARQMCEKFKVPPIIEGNGKQRLSFEQAVTQRKKFRDG